MTEISNTFYNPYPYFYFIAFFFIFTLIQNNKTVDKQLVYLYYTFVFFVMLVIGFRGNYDEYTRVFVLIPTLENFFNEDYNVISEKGYVFTFISSTFKTIGFNSQSLFLFFSSTAVFIHAYFFRKFTKYYFLAFLLYLSHEICLKEWIGLRMGFASALLLPMIYYLYKGQKVKFFILVVIATLVQYVAILSLFLYFLRYRIKPIYLFLGLVVALLLMESGIVYQTVWSLDSMNILPGIISSYMRTEVYVYDVGLNHPKTIQQIIVITIFILLIHKKDNEDIPKVYYLLFNAYYLGTILMIIFSELALFAFRFNGHFASVEPILITYLIYKFRHKILVSSFLAFGSLMVAYINYIVIRRVPDYFLFVNYP